MKAAPILLGGLGIGAAAIALHLGSSGRSGSSATDIRIRRGAAPLSWTPPVSSSVGLQPGASSDAPTSEETARASSGTLTTIHAIVQSKLREWRNTATGETAIQERLTQELLGMLSNENTAEIIRSLSLDDLHTPFGAAVVERWLNIAQAEAAQWLATRPDATEHHAWLVARRMDENPAELLAFCDQLPANEWREQVLRHASLEKADTKPLVAIAFAERLLTEAARTNALETIAYAWCARDPVAALRWAETISDSALRERLLAVSAKAIARVDVDLALDLLIAGVNTDGLVQETALSILETPAQ